MSISKYLLLLFFLSSPIKATDYYVAIDGDDGNVGTSVGQPLATIQKAIDQMGAGDTCYLKGGRYQQVIDLKGKAGAQSKPITLAAYQGEAVTIDGTAELKAQWTLDKDQVYKTTVSEDVIQLFHNDEALTLARFPNAPAFSDLAFHEKNRREKAAASKRRTVIDNPTSGRVTPIAEMGIDFTDCVAVLNFGDHVTSARLVIGHKEGSNTFAYKPNVIPFKNTKGYFFEGGKGNADRALLDSPGEWSYDETKKTLYLWAQDSKKPADQTLRYKKHSYSLLGNAQTKDIVIDGLNFLATSFLFESSDRITLQNCDFNYPAVSKRSLGDTAIPLCPQFKGTQDDLCEGLFIDNCTFRHADGGALRGSATLDALVENCHFYRIDYAPIGLAGAVNFQASPGFVYRRNTLEISGDAMGLICSPTCGKITKPWVMEYNYHTKCGLMETDGSSLYSVHEGVIESVGRYNWFIGNDARDYRWDGHNRPKVMGLRANFYRNVMMADRIKGIATGGDGARLKGDYHEVYNNTGVYRWSDIDVALDKGGNAHSQTRNNAADKLTGNIKDPKVASHNFFGRPGMGVALRDPDNWDFRPKPGLPHLIDKGTPVTCSVNGKDIDVTAGFKGEAPDIGAYEHDASTYWIPGRQEAQAAMPVPKVNGQHVKLNTDLMYLIGRKGVSAKIYFGTDPKELSLLTSQKKSTNIVKLSDFQELKGNTTYYWRVDTEKEDASVVTGKVWSFTTEIERKFFPWTKRTVSGGASWKQPYPKGPLVYDNNGPKFSSSALVYSKDSYQSNGGLRVTLGYVTGSISKDAGHALSFGLISTDTNLAKYKGKNPFGAASQLYGLGVNIAGPPESRGLHFTNGKGRKTLDVSGTKVQFGTQKKFHSNESNVVVIEIGPEGRWRYSINGTVEAGGHIPEGFDLSKSYHVAVFGQDDHGDGKVIQHLSIDTM